MYYIETASKQLGDGSEYNLDIGNKNEENESSGKYEYNFDDAEDYL